MSIYYSPQSPGGSNGELQFNNNNVFGGVAGSSIDGSGNITLSSRLINSLNGAASLPPVALTGTWFTGGTSTTTKPQFLIEPAGTTSTSWSTFGTGLGLNAPPGFPGNLLDLQVNGVTRVQISAAGNTTFTGAVTATTYNNLPAEIGLAVSDESSPLTVGTRFTVRMPYAMTLTSVRLSVTTAPAGSALVVNVLDNGVSVFSTKPQIDSGSTTSVGSTTPSVISNANLANNDVITVNIDQIGSTFAGAGLKLWLIGRRA